MGCSFLEINFPRSLSNNNTNVTILTRLPGLISGGCSKHRFEDVLLCTCGLFSLKIKYKFPLKSKNKARTDHPLNCTNNKMENKILEATTEESSQRKSCDKERRQVQKPFSFRILVSGRNPNNSEITDR